MLTFKNGPAHPKIYVLLAEFRVAKSQFFYTDQIFQTMFYPKKNAQVATNLKPYLNEIKAKGHFLGRRLNILPNKAGFTTKTHKSWKILLTRFTKLCCLLHFLPKTLNILT